MRLNWFYYKTGRAVHKQFIPNPSIIFKCTFPSFEQSVTAHLQWAGITFRLALCTVKFVLFFFISNSSFDCMLQSSQHADLSCSTRCSPTHFQPSGWTQACAIVQQLSAHSPQPFPVAMLTRKSHPGWAGDTTRARAACHAQRGCCHLWDGTNGSCPTAHVPPGLGGCQGLPQLCWRAMNAKVPWLFIPTAKLARTGNVHTPALSAQGCSQESWVLSHAMTRWVRNTGNRVWVIKDKINKPSIRKGHSRSVPCHRCSLLD